MRTTVTLDDDLALRLERWRIQRGSTFKDVLNEVIRRGLDALDAPAPQRADIDIRPLPLGRRVVDIDNVSEALAIADGEDFH
ncbi:DUF2191 domain-containing protein [Nocardia cyriacigeorgica]|uniref:DUF2191 domain-containing protein n=1 Tax=Nocardia cyriacigeorgica TaxID=135487 RepID=A0A5R8NWK1_9NOCA|nr:DUF2191 domain-containing protein [Nocardia cyriacigeorgica]TLF79168.1 DUF2191 domain-containing protein [Nocardia cyriacigeorgica]